MLKNHIVYIFSGISLCLLSTTIFSSTGHFYTGFSAGADWLEIGKSNDQITYYYGLLTDNYPVSKKHATQAMVGINAGYEWMETCTLPAIALGLGFYTAPGDYHFNGRVIETPIGDPSLYLHDYDYRISSTRLMGEGQLTWFLNHHIASFMNFGLGAAWNRASHYSEKTVAAASYVPLPPFHSHTKSNVAYQIGVGVGYAFNFNKSGCCEKFKHERISLGYRYINLGNASFGDRGDVYPYHLNIGRLTTNEIDLNYTHLF